MTGRRAGQRLTGVPLSGVSSEFAQVDLLFTRGLGEERPTGPEGGVQSPALLLAPHRGGCKASRPPSNSTCTGPFSPAEEPVGQDRRRRPWFPRGSTAPHQSESQLQKVSPMHHKAVPLREGGETLAGLSR